MNIAVDSQPNLDPERLRLVTQNLSGLQTFSMRGLGFAAFGAAFATMHASTTYWKSDWVGPLVLACLGLFALSLLYVPRYYRWRFGWAEARKAPVPEWVANLSFKQVFIAVAALFLLWLLIDVLAHALPVRIDLMPLLTWLGVLCAVLWLRQRIGTLWSNYVLVVFLIAVGIAWITFYPLWHSLAANQLLIWRTLTAGSMGLGYMILGLYDHIMLVRLMPKRVAESDHE
jgi:hypothetical protein